ncbi:MAG: rhamnose transport system permease protein [Thermomicrobiales bacterium]|jgi:rhamnose transport system permease protein|nr:rhamnose transport system permease protein [Thermomicrobiales bacterium]
MASDLMRRLRSWEGLLLVCLLVVLAFNIARVSNFLTINNQVNLFQLGIEKAIVTLAMAFVIVSGEIDLSVASMMGLSAAITANLFERGVSLPLAVVVALGVGALFGLLNGYFVAVLGLSSLAVTLAGYVGFRGLARLLVEDRSVGGFPGWFTDLGQQGLLGPVTLSILIFAVLAVLGTVVLHFSGLGRLTYVIGNSAQVARFSGVSVARTKMTIFTISGLVSALAGVLMAARLGAVRASTAEGAELDIITVVLLGGVSIFGGVGSMVGVLLSTYLVLNLRNGLVIAGITGNTQTGIIGLLLILSVLLPNVAGRVRERLRRGRADPGVRAPPVGPAEAAGSHAAPG